MKDLLPIVIVVFSVVVTLTFLVSTIVEEIKYKKRVAENRNTIEKEVGDSEYLKICEVTKPIESDRHSNNGKHYEESVYLDRAKEIRNNTPLFKWIN